MGRGGRGGGTSRSSSHSSRGFSSHSSSTHHSSHSTHHSSYRPTHHSTYHRPYRRSYNSGYGYGNRGLGCSGSLLSGCLSKLIGMVLSFAIIGGILFAIFVVMPHNENSSNTYNNSSHSVTRSARRAKLAANKCYDTGSYYTDELGWIHNSSKLERGMRTFYQKTGVQPHLYITDNIDGDRSGNYSLTKQEDFGNALYDEYFEDEGHVMVVFCEYRDSEYVCFAVAGSDAKAVLDSNGREILLDCIDDLYYSDMEDEEFFSRAFENAARKLMQ